MADKGYMRGAGTILVAEDDEAIRLLMSEFLSREGYAVRAVADGSAALEAVSRELPDLILTDVMMPGLNGFELCRRLKSDRATRLVPVVLVTSLNAREDRLEGITAGADDFLTKPFDSAELKARVASLIRLKRFTDDLDSAESVILSLALTVEAREPNTAGHCERMAAYAAAFGVYLDLPDADLAALHRGGFLHDVGKIAVPDNILCKKESLTPLEFEVMKRHTIVGEKLCGELRVLRPVRPIVRHHHERFDGSGYPDGLRGNEIPLLAQITGIVDVYDALTADRAYRAALSIDVACAELRKESERGWRRRDLVEEFITLARSGRLQRTAESWPGPVPLHDRCA
jgi:putative two-component system response regulator